MIVVAKRYSETEPKPKTEETKLAKKALVLGKLKRGDLKKFSRKDRKLLSALEETIKEGAV